MGGKPKQPPNPPPPYEAPNSLFSEQTVKILDLVGEGEIKGFVVQSGAYGSDPLTSVFYNDIRVRNLDGTYNYNVTGQGFSIGYTLGTTNQTPITNFGKIENIIPFGGSSRLYNPPVGQGLSTSVVCTFNTTTYPDADSVKITVRVPALLSQDSKGNTNGFEIKYAVDIALGEGPFIEKGVYTINGKCTSPYLRQTTHTLPKTDQSNYTWRVRIRRTTPNILSIKTQNDLYVDSISVISSSSLNYPTSVLVGTYLSAEQFPQIPARSYEMDGTLVSVPVGYTPTVINTNGTYTAAVYPPVWNGTFDSTKKWTNNPAWILYDLITNKRYGLGKYVIPEWVDKWSLYEIAQHCDELVDDGKGGFEPRFTINCTLQQRTEAYDLLQNIVSAFRGMMYFANGKIFTTQTVDKGPVYNYTNANVVDGSFTYADTARNTRSTVILVKWSDPTNLYREAVERIEDPEGILRYGYIEKEVTAFGCTSKGQAFRLGSWILYTERLITETITFSVGNYGNYLRPGDIFSVYDNYRFNKQQGGRILDLTNSNNDVILDRPITLEPGYTYAISLVSPTGNLDDPNLVTDSSEIPLMRNPQIQTRLITNIPGEYTTVNVDSHFTNFAHKGTVFLISASGDAITVQNRSLQYRCLATSETKPGIQEILGLEYSTGINYDIERNYSVINLPVNEGDDSPIDPPTSLIVNPITGLLSNNKFFSYIDLTWGFSPSSNLAYYKASGQQPGQAWVNFATPTNTGTTYPLTKTGYHAFLVCAVSEGGKESTFVSGSYSVPTTNPLGGPPIFTGLSIYLNNNPFAAGPSGTYTGFYTSAPGFKWDTIYDINGNPEPKVQFLDKYVLRIVHPTTNNQLYQEVTVEDPSYVTFDIPTGVLYNLTGGHRREFKVVVESHDVFGKMITGASLIVSNPAPLPPTYSGFFGQNGGFNYNINPNKVDQDISGVYFWFNQDPSFTPTYYNKSGVSESLAGFMFHQMTGKYNIWYSLIDTYTVSGCPIYGPMEIRTALGVTGIKVPDPAEPFIEGGVIVAGTGYVHTTQDGQYIIINSTGIKSGQGFDLYYAGEGNWVISGKALEITGNLSDVQSRTVARANINQGLVTLSDAANITTDCSLGNVFQVTLGGNRTLNQPTNMATGATYIWMIKQDGAGSRTLTFDQSFHFPDGSSKELSSDPGARDIYTCVCDGTGLYGVLAKQFGFGS